MVMKRRAAIMTGKMELAGIRRIFCTHSDSFAYRNYGEFSFVEFCACSKCGKTLKLLKGFDEDMRG